MIISITLTMSKIYFPDDIHRYTNHKTTNCIAVRFVDKNNRSL